MMNFTYGPTSDSGFAVNWDSAFEGSIAVPNRFGAEIKMRRSGWPYLLVAVAYSVGGFDLFDDTARLKMEACALGKYGSLLEKAKSDADDMEKLRAECREMPFPICETLKMAEVEETLKDANVDLERTYYAGLVPASVECEPVHVLSSDAKETYIAQWWRGMNMLRLNEEQAKEMIKSVPKFY